MSSCPGDCSSFSIPNQYWDSHWLVIVGLDFVFLDLAGRPYYCHKWGDELWLFYWHKEQHWVSLRQVAEDEIALFPHNLSPDDQQQYHDLHNDINWSARL